MGDMAVTKMMLVGAGGFLGAILRYGVSGLVQAATRSIGFPYGTLTVNVIGCLVIGILSQMVASRGLFSPELRIFIFIGLLGSFTTFSTFGNETFNLLRDGETVSALAYVGLHLVVGLGAVWLGHMMAWQLWR